MAKRILLTTTGSLGDLHPFIAIGLELMSRGHAVTIATSDFYRTKVEHTGLRFAPMAPHLTTETSMQMEQVMDLRNGPEYLIRRLLVPAVPVAYREVMDVIGDNDIIVTHPITFASQIAAEKTGMPWISTVTTPLCFWSCFDPPVIPAYQWTSKLRVLGPGFFRALKQLGHLMTKRWIASLQTFRASVGLPAGKDPNFEGQHSPQRVLALFSPLLAAPQPDWPPNTTVTGFPFYDQAEHGQRLDPDLDRFLDAGSPPVVFTLGSSAVQSAGNFYHESLAAVRRLGCRAVFLVGAIHFRKRFRPALWSYPTLPMPRSFPGPRQSFIPVASERAGRGWLAGIPCW
jgi:UDP:flavonoid glycosyltransferase YjiC (YdhE family)